MSNPFRNWTPAMVEAFNSKCSTDTRGKILQGVLNEATLHNQIIAECRRRSWQYLHGSMAAETHRTLGEPDFVVLADRGRVFLIECKSRDGKLSPSQRDFKAHAERNGHRVHVVRSLQEFNQLTIETRGKETT